MKTDYEKGLEFAARSLSRKAQLTFELHQKLLKRDVSEEDAERIIEYLTGLGYLNDQELILRMVHREREKGNGDRVIFQKLLQKGVPREHVEQNLESRSQEDEIEQLKAIIAKKFPDYRPDDAELRNKLVQKFLRKGFNYECIKSALI